MASGRRHDRATRLLALPFGLLCWPWLGPVGAAVGGLAFLVGGLWLSPDLDTRSRPTRRWGPLGLLWWPYRRMLSHRSLLSHCPFVGTALRLAYLATVVALAAALLAPFGGPPRPGGWSRSRPSGSGSVHCCSRPWWVWRPAAGCICFRTAIPSPGCRVPLRRLLGISLR